MMLVHGASLQTEVPEYGFGDREFEYARAFQNRVAKWVHEDSESVAVLRAPTGAGKTATFYELVESHDLTLLVYPTNALLRQQRNRFENDNVDSVVLNSNTLDGRSHERTENLLQFVNKYSDHEVVITNPDILQAAIQDMYRGAQAMDFFDRFDAIVYDEFHFYDTLAASGLLLQTKIIEERIAEVKILLASATPNEDLVEFVRDRIGIDVIDISATYAEDGDQFRHDVLLDRRDTRRILDDKETIADELRDAIATATDLSNPHVVLVFNSVKDSNEFHRYLNEEHEDVFKHAEKDNGFDTDDEAASLEDGDFYILNTTSKGEVGLDYDVQTLYMENPNRASAFLQRFGRAGRESKATVSTFGLNQALLDEEMSFPEFEERVYDALDDQRMDLDWLADLVGFRAAYALYVREQDNTRFNEELREDFKSNVEQYDQWRGFIYAVECELDEVGSGIGDYRYPERSTEAKLLRFTKTCFRAFRGLRGRSLPAEIKYPRGDRVGVTTYSLTTTLRHYDIDHVEEDTVIVLKPPATDALSPVTARLPEFGTEPTRYDQPTREIEEILQTRIHRKIDDLTTDVQVRPELLHRFFQIVRITDAVVPERLTTAEFEIAVSDEEGRPPKINVSRRQI